MQLAASAVVMIPYTGTVTNLGTALGARIALTRVCWRLSTPHDAHFFCTGAPEVLNQLYAAIRLPDIQYIAEDMAAIPPLELTDPNVIPEIANDVRSTFLTHKTRSLEFRLVQLRKLYWGRALLPILS